jgi:hypothetical protein
MAPPARTTRRALPPLAEDRSDSVPAQNIDELRLIKPIVAQDPPTRVIRLSSGNPCDHRPQLHNRDAFKALPKGGDHSVAGGIGRICRRPVQVLPNHAIRRYGLPRSQPWRRRNTCDCQPLDNIHAGRAPNLVLRGGDIVVVEDSTTRGPQGYPAVCSFRPLLSLDVLAKRDITPAAEENALQLYRYRYAWSDPFYVGVLAQGGS